MVSNPANIEPIRGPMYGMIFKIAHKKAITIAFSTPKINSTIRYNKQIMVN